MTANAPARLARLPDAVAASVTRLVDAAPELTRSQADRLARLLRPPQQAAS